jgi:iron-sulfur cluster repair protein YtfE (RIC family)
LTDRRIIDMAATVPSIRTYFAEDHDRLDGLFARFQERKRADYAEAKPFFREFKFGLQRHIVWEEQILFPLFEEKTGLRDIGPTAVMRHEHRRIGQRLEALHDKVRRHDPESDAEEQALREALEAHNLKEETALYPALDRLLTDEEKQGVAEAMARLPEEAYRTCCGHHGPHE